MAPPNIKNIRRRGRRKGDGYRTIQCECCSSRFPSHGALANHRTQSRICYERYHSKHHGVPGVCTNFTTSNQAIRTNYTSGSIDIAPSSAAVDMESSDDVKMVDNIPDSNVFNNNSSSDEANESDSAQSNNYRAWEESSHSSNSAASMDEDDFMNMEDDSDYVELVKGIDTVFDNTPLEQTLKEYNFTHSDGSDVEETASTNKDKDQQPIPIGGDASMRAQVTLLKLLEQTSTPIGLYDKIMDWASDAQVMGYNFPDTPKRRETVINDFSERFRMHAMHAKNTTFPLEGGGLATLTHFDIGAMIKSLMSDPRLSEYFIINWENPNESVLHNTTELGDVHTGRWCKNTQKEMCTEWHHLLGPIILASDRAHCDEGGKSRLSLEPMLFTLAIIPQELRVHEWAWRPIGYLNNLHLAPSAEISKRTPGQNVRNTHRMLRIMFAGLKKIQEQGGLHIDIVKPQSGGVEVKLLLKVPIAFIIGDCKGHDVLCGRFASHKIEILCRDCNCLHKDADNHLTECQMRKMCDIKHLTDQKPTEEVLKELQILGQHYVRNAFYELDFGQNPGGIHTATPIETLHGIELGWFKYALKGFFDLLTPTETTQFDLLSKGFSQQHKHQSYRDFPRTSFPHGFSNVTRLQGHEYVGCLLLSVLVLSSRPWKIVMMDIKPRKQNRINQYFDLFETLLSFHAFTKSKTHLKKNIRKGGGGKKPLATQAIQVCIQKFKKVIRRKAGHGSKLTKIHQMLHIAYYIEMYGAALNWYGSPCESLHKWFVKKPGRKTQRRPDLFEEQAAKRVVESYIITLAYGLIMGRELDKKQSQLSREIGGTRFEIHVKLNKNCKYVSGCHKIVWLPIQKNGGQTRTALNEGAIIETIKNCYTLFPREPFSVVKISCFTEHKRDGTIYHGHPNFRGMGEWHDYAYFEWDGITEGLIGRIYFFVDLNKSTDTGSMTLTQRRRIESFYCGQQCYAITRSSDRSSTPKNDSVLMSSDQLDHSKWYFPCVSSILGPVYCVFDSLVDEEEDLVTIALPQDEWKTRFL
jgi:hypothetical protein